MRILFDAREYTWFRPDNIRFGGSELILLNMASALRDAGHEVGIIHRGDETLRDGVYYYPESKYPTHCDTLIAFETNFGLKEFSFERVFMVVNRLSPDVDVDTIKQVERVICVGDWANDRIPRVRPITREQMMTIAPGVNLSDYNGNGHKKVPNRLVYCSASDRGLYHLMEMWPLLKKKRPDASLTITYNLTQDYERQKWAHNFDGLKFNEMKRWVELTDGVEDIGPCTREELINAQKEAHIFPYPCDPPLYGSELFCISALECAAAKCALLLADQEALYSVYEGVAAYLPIPIDHAVWVEAICNLLRDKNGLREYQNKGLEFAKKHTWERFGEQWRHLVDG